MSKLRTQLLGNANCSMLYWAVLDVYAGQLDRAQKAYRAKLDKLAASSPNTIAGD